MQDDLHRLLISQEALALRLNNMLKSYKTSEKIVDISFSDLGVRLDVIAQIAIQDKKARLISRDTLTGATKLMLSLPCNPKDPSLSAYVTKFNATVDELYWKNNCQQLSNIFNKSQERVLRVLNISSFKDIKTAYTGPACSDLCLSIATQYHSGQVDKAGNPYINHPVAVAGYFVDERLRCIALLHDILEDTDCTSERLAQLQIPSAIIHSVEAITHNDSVPYEEYIKILARDKYATLVKIADLSHNMTLSRLPVVNESTYKRCKRYCSAITYLTETLIERGVNDLCTS